MRRIGMLTARPMSRRSSLCSTRAVTFDILPTVSRTVPELPRPLKSWGAQWLVQEILAARDRRLFPSLVLRKPLAADEAVVVNILRGVELEGHSVAPINEVEAPPPARRLSAMEADPITGAPADEPEAVMLDFVCPLRSARQGVVFSRQTRLNESLRCLVSHRVGRGSTKTPRRPTTRSICATGIVSGENG
jgi:hypothetical protein